MITLVLEIDRFGPSGEPMEARYHTREDLHQSAARAEGKKKHQQQTTRRGEHEEPCEDPLSCVKSLSLASYSLFTSCLEISLNCESPRELAQQGLKLLELLSARCPQLSARRPQLGARLHNFFPRRLKEQVVDSPEQVVDSSEQVVDQLVSGKESLKSPGAHVLEALPSLFHALPPLFHRSSTPFLRSATALPSPFLAFPLRGGVEEQWAKPCM